MKFKKLKEDIKLPIKAHKHDCGFDCYLPNKITLLPSSVTKINLQISIKLKKNECAIICARSSIASKNIILNTSPIDCGYDGPIHAIVHNLTNEYIIFNKNERICQIVIFKIPYIKTKIINKTKRSKSNFGSSGKE